MNIFGHVENASEEDAQAWSRRMDERLKQQRDTLAEALRNVLDSNEIEAADARTARAVLAEMEDGV